MIVLKGLKVGAVRSMAAFCIETPSMALERRYWVCGCCRYVLASRELPEYMGQKYNDEFQLLVNNVNVAKLTNGQVREWGLFCLGTEQFLVQCELLHIMHHMQCTVISLLDRALQSTIWGHLRPTQPHGPTQPSGQHFKGMTGYHMRSAVPRPDCRSATGTA